MTKNNNNPIRKRILQSNSENIALANNDETVLDPLKFRDSTGTIHECILKRWHGNDNIVEFIENEKEIDDIQDEVEYHFQKILEALIIDTDHDHNTKDTAKRVAKMFVRELFAGRFEKQPKITTFPNVGYDQVYISGPISVRSTCAHHFMPIVGNCWVGIKPGKDVIGLSKFNRLINWVVSRPQIQEEMTEQIADVIEEACKPEGLAVTIKAEHFCMTHRGVREHESDMTTSVMRGEFQTNQNYRQEFLMLMNNMKGHSY